MTSFLHRSNGSDWKNTKPADQNRWQQLAASSYGILTLANLISIIGAALVGYGLFEIDKQSVIAGLIFIVLGRCADILDGLVADFTKTKSTLGETLDATVDKIVIFTALIILFSHHILPDTIFAAVLIQNFYNSILAVVARLMKLVIHPSLAGKWSAALAWSTLLAYILASQLKDRTSFYSFIHTLANISFTLFLITAVIGSYHYTKDAIREAKQ